MTRLEDRLPTEPGRPKPPCHCRPLKAQDGTDEKTAGRRSSVIGKCELPNSIPFFSGTCREYL